MEMVNASRPIEKDTAVIVPSQIFPNSMGSTGQSSLSELSSTTSLSENKPTFDFSNLLQRRNGSVLSRDVILKSEHFFKGMNNVDTELKLLGAPNFRSTNLNIYGAAQPSLSGLTTILRVLGCGPDSSSQTNAEMKRAVWFSTREEPIIYINDNPFVVRDSSNPFVNIKSYSGISGNRLESVEKRLKADIMHEAKRNNGLILVHDELDDHTIVPCLVSVDTVRTTREVLEEIQAKGFSVDYYRIPVSHEQSPTDPYIDEYFQVFAGTKTDWPVIFSCGMGIGRTTYGMVIGLLIRRAQIIHATGNDPFNISSQSLQDFNSRSRTMLRLVYILEQGLQSKQSSQSAIEWIFARSGMIDQLELALNGHYTVINDLVRVLYNGSLCKQIVDAAIDRCDTVVNIREHILLYRVRSFVKSGPNSSLDTGLGFLERYFSLIAFCEYIESQLFKGSLQSKSFQAWMQGHKEIWKMLTYLRSSSNKVKAFRPIDDLTELKGPSSISAIRSPELKTVSEDIAVVKSRSGSVLGPNTVLKIDHWPSGKDVERSVELPVQIQGAPNFRQIDLSLGRNHQIYAVAQPTLSALRTILNHVCSNSPLPVKRIVWVNVREEPLIYINGEPFVLRDQYASLRNIKAYTGITDRRLEQMELKLKEDIIAESKTFSNRILLHSEGPSHELLPIWESVNQINTLRELFSVQAELCAEFPELEYFRVPITAEEPPEAGDFDLLRQIMTDKYPSTSTSTVYIFNCQMGVGRSTTAAVIGSQILVKMLQLPCPCRPEHPALIHYKIVTNLIRMIKHGVESRRIVDCIIDRAGTLVNLRQCIEDYRKAASKCTDDQQNCRKAVLKGMHCLKRYVLLIMFQSFLFEAETDAGEQSTFTAWMMGHPEFASLFHELESKGLEGLTVLSDVDNPADIADQGIDATSKQPVADLDVMRVVAGREGSVLAPMTILKFDHFIGCQKQSLPERIDGAPNFRQIPLIEGKFVCGLAMPTKDAIARVLERIGCVSGNGRRCLWISMREEPVIFANGQPYVLRIVKDPVTNLEMTGIVSKRVELMEERLKQEAIQEAARFNDHLLLHEEEASRTSPQGFEIVPEWEKIEELESPAEVYQHVIQSGNYPLTYYRVPVTDEQAPILNVFDELIRHISEADYTDFIFNCQMGRGRTTTGMVITMLYHRIKALPETDLKSTASSKNGSVDGCMPFLRGEYKLINRLCQILDHGLLAKQLTDECMDELAQLQNLREAIYDFKRKYEADPTGPQASDLHYRGLNYLLRYFYLIVFAEYLIEELSEEGGTLSKSFLQWISERREITNLTLHERGELSLK